MKYASSSKSSPRNKNQNNGEIGEDIYDFGSVKYASSSKSSLADGGGRSKATPSRSGSVKSSRSYRDNHLDGSKYNNETLKDFKLLKILYMIGF